MSSLRSPLQETHIVSPDTQVYKVAAADCPALANYHIAHVAVADTSAPYEVVRMDLAGTFLFSCYRGRGRILLDGRWQLMKEGDACIAPPHVLLAFHCEPKYRWEITWVRYQQPADQKAIIQSSSPAMAKLDPEPIRHAVLGLYHEQQTQHAPATVRHWVEIIHSYVVRFASPWQTDDRLGALWEHVSRTLGEPWSLDRLAHRCHLSTEHLRRLCRRELGRSPMHHVIYLRMQHAAKLLTTTDDKIETIAHECGYENPFVFSSTFKKWVGWRPSDYRARKV